ncbi:MAG TPA: CPBP family intramembrane glutamic endopeptidase [Polyangiaceae bacterium]|jgi:membrane protease YdiL (CAAX protease family)|nr:CPBP family intramembrane glutamic endopeptidase [Polyangiaceae bacterium]
MRNLERSSTDDLIPFFALACGITWMLAAPLAAAWMHHDTPSSLSVSLAGLSAFGPLFAALVVASRQRRLGEVFSRWRTGPAWVVLALFAPMAVHLVAVALALALGERQVTWLHPPATAEHVAALVVFPLGEEFGWRGYAYPRLVDRLGVVKGALVLGVVWGLWHLVYSVTPVAGAFDVRLFAMGMVELPLYSILIAWVFERANRSMAVAIAFHAGAHLDHIELAPLEQTWLHVMHLIVLAVLAAVAAGSLGKTARVAAIA